MASKHGERVGAWKGKIPAPQVQSAAAATNPAQRPAVLGDRARVPCIAITDTIVLSDQ